MLTLDRHAPAATAHPPLELPTVLRDGQPALSPRRIVPPLREDVRQPLELQRLQHPLPARQRPLCAWERPWDIDV